MMPYIKQKIREKIDPAIKELGLKIVTSAENNGRAGNTNYAITKLMGEVFGPIEDMGYNDFNEVIGVLECCKQEFYRKQISPYEDFKEKQNGEVFPFQKES